MTSLFKHHDTLRLFVEIAQHRSFSDAAESLHMTKGAISYQVKTLEANLQLKLFERQPRGIRLTQEGQDVLNVSRIQPMTQLFELERQGVDLAIRWGNGLWDDVEIQPFMPMAAWPVGSPDAAERIRQVRLERAISEFTLLRDHDNSNAWSDWLDVAGLPPQTRKDTLIIPDPNVRVQAVIDGQGIALNDALVSRELEAGQLVRLSDIELSSYGYFLARPRTSHRRQSIDAFTNWLRQL